MPISFYRRIRAVVRVLLIRHAPAFDRDRKRWPDDRQRPLTPEGIVKFRKAAAGLKRLTDPIERVLVSPLTRARETADVLAKVCEWPPAVLAPELAPEGTPAQVLKLIRAQASAQLAIVGHEPNLAELLSVSVAGVGVALSCELKKGGAACLTFATEARPGRGCLEWLLTPKALRAIGMRR